MALPQNFFDDDTGTPLPQQQYGDSEQSGPPGPTGPAGPAGPAGGGLLINTTALPGTGYAVAQDAAVASKARLTRSDNGIEQALCIGFYQGTPGTVERENRCTVKFTTAGGMPALGEPVYLAAHTDDAGTGDGKLTATPPTALGFIVAAVGVCMDNALYAGSKTCVIAPFIQLPYQIYPSGIPLAGGG